LNIRYGLVSEQDKTLSEKIDLFYYIDTDTMSTLRHRSTNEIYYSKYTTKMTLVTKMILA